MRATCLKCAEFKDVNNNGICAFCNEEEKIIEKIKKLLALSKSPNKSEAELAVERAHDLLTKYNLSINDVQERIIRERNVITGRSLKKWKHLLIVHIARYYFCQSLCYERGSGYYLIVFIGQNHNIEICKSMYDYLEKAVIREARTIRKNAKYTFRENFKLGMAHQISIRLKELSILKSSPDEKALVITENKLIEQYLENKNTYSEDFDLDPENINAYIKGKIAGDKVSLNDQIKNDNRQINS